ncbi:eukaryotic translation initiation factor 2A [Takifugu rubripes]|uniref:eukaryotic translation initiation factor 2A n=1 Tax=Takifugu rubripes TaxID=31033 RepID=UPI001145F612|nr:eukaryotic translation initiation factor 2A [Takifugu rubripes]
MAPPAPLLAVRGSVGTSLLHGPPLCEPHSGFSRDSKASRCLAFSRDGTLFSWCNGQDVAVVKCSDGSVVSRFDLPKTSLLDFSPRGTILVTWQVYSKTPSSPQGEANLQLWDVQSGQLIKALFQKKMEAWCPSWSDGEQLCVRSVNNELHFYENNDFNTIANKLHMQKVSDFKLSPGDQPCKVAVYVPGTKGAPSFVRLYQYPALAGPAAALANKSFFKADKVDMQWNHKGTAVLVTASVDVDKTGASYYGEQTLHYLATNGETAAVQLPKNGPIYDVAWSPNSSQFCVVFGFMPAKATIYNLNCDPVFDFGTGPRNAAYYSPQGHILVLAGFGNLQGQMEVWDLKKYKQVSKPQAQDSTHFSWCPDGEHIVTATCSPRLRVSNGFRIWHYTGSVLHKHEVAAGSELWEVCWQPVPEGVFPERAISYQSAPSELGTTQTTVKQAYRPPALRHLPAKPSARLQEEEPPQDLRAGGKVPSKVALKNQKKREAKKAARQEGKAAAAPVPPAAQSRAELHTCEPESDKKMKNIKKKLKAIDQLKEMQASGEVLQKNQLEKIQKEEQLLQELQELEIRP